MPALPIRVHYDAKDNILEVDATGAKPSPEVIDEIFDRLVPAARSAPLPWVLTCWAGVELDIDSARQYGKRMEDLKPLVRGVVRYAVPDGTRIQIRSEFIKHKLSDRRTQFFETRSEAIAAIRKGLV